VHSSIEAIDRKVKQLKQQYAARDSRMYDVQAVRAGNVAEIFPHLFPKTWPKPVVANFIDVAARDLAEVIAPLPSFNCSSGQMVTEAAKKRAARRTKIVHYYVQHSQLAQQMTSGADQYLTYGFLPMVVEPDFEAKCPRLRLEDPMGGYPEFDRWGVCTAYAKRTLKTVAELAAEWPEYRGKIVGQDPLGVGQGAMLEVIRFSDSDQTVLYVPERDSLVLARVENKLGRCPVVVVRRPGLDSEIKGQFDDVLWVQMARARIALLQLEAAEKSVGAPLAIPSDVQEMSFGPDAILRTNSPEKIRRVGMELPPGAFAESAALDEELHTGARYPEGRQGEVNASVITGRGIQSLLGGFDTQVKTAQLMFEQALEQVLSLMLRADEAWFGNVKKTVRGTANGTRFEESYIPSKDIGGDYTVDVTYGFAAGMDPNRALVFMLQLRGDNLISRDTVQRQLPFDVDVVQMQQSIDIEDTRDALKQAVFGLGQAIPALAAQVADPQQVMGVIEKLAGVIKERERGVTIEDAVAKLFAPPPPPEPTPEQLAAGGVGGAGADVEGLGADGLPEGVAAGQAGLPPGGRPDLQVLLAGLSSSGKPTLASSVNRRLPIA
jgi:hypothetical protein